MAGGKPVLSSLIQSKLGSGYTIATAKQVQAASFAGFQIFAPSLFNGYGDSVCACRCVQFLTGDSSGGSGLGGFYTPFVKSIHPQANSSPSIMTIQSNQSVALLVFGVKPKPTESFKIKGQNFNIFPFYSVIPGETASRSNVWSQFDSFSMCNVKSPNCMYPFQVEFDGIPQYVNSVTDASGIPTLVITPTPVTSWILAPNNLIIMFSESELSIAVAPDQTSNNQYVSLIGYSGSSSQLNSNTLFLPNTDGTIVLKSSPSMGLSCDVSGRLTVVTNPQAWLKFTQPLWNSL